MPVFRFSTDRLPPDLTDGARARIWADGMQRFGLTFDCPREDGFRGEVEHVTEGPLDLSWAFASSAVAGRRPSSSGQHRDGPAFMMFTNLCETPKTAAQRGREAVLAAGELVLLDHAHAHVTGAPVGGRALSLQLGRAEVEASGIDIARAICRPVSARNPAVQLFRGYVDTVMRSPPPDEGVAAAVAAHLLDLAILALGGQADAMERARRRGLEAVRIQAIRKCIAQGCPDPQFDASDVSRDLRLSIRTLQGVLARAGTTFSQELIEARLDLAGARLRSREPTRETVTQIAFETGFNSLSTFYRAFRARFGHPPGDLR